jgi:steroid delta-isomerase-like uncharacterized protein
MGMSTATSSEENKRIARRVPEEIATRRNFDAIREVFAEDAIERQTMGDARGHEEIERQLRATIGAFPDFEARVEETVAEGDVVAMRVTLSGTHEGDFMGIAPTGERMEISNMVFSRVEDGKITERWVTGDVLGALVQLGVVEPPFDRPDT